MEQRFWKYEGAGNDFVLIDDRKGGFDASADVVARFCDRHFGIGADGLMILRNDTAGGEFLMRYFNSDGAESTMCGNGGRCIALFAHHLGIGKEHKRFNSADGFHEAAVDATGPDTAFVELGMSDVKSVERDAEGFFLDTGSPHCVVFVEDVDSVDVFDRGRRIRCGERFAPEGTNVNFVQIVADGYIKMRTYERGVEDETLACGTGATASAIAARLYARSAAVDWRADVPGGRLRVRFSTCGEGKFTGIVLSGPARRVFRGVADMDNFTLK